MAHHYVYRITNKAKNKHYYGVRSSSNPPKEDLGLLYFSSSSDEKFIEDQKTNPDDYKYKVIKEYSSREEATKKEIKLHAKFNVGSNTYFYSKANQTSVGFDTSGTKFPGRTSSNKGKKMSEEQKQKISKSLKGKKFSDQRKKNISNSLKGVTAWNKGKKMSKDFIEKHYSNRTSPMEGKTHNNSTKQKMSIAAKKLPKVACPYCNKQGKGNSMKRWHFENCKFKEIK